TAGEDDLLDRFGPGDARQGSGPAGGRRGLLGVGEMATEAVAAVDGATAGGDQQGTAVVLADHPVTGAGGPVADRVQAEARGRAHLRVEDRKSTRLNSSHVKISYAVFCLK